MLQLLMAKRRFSGISPPIASEIISCIWLMFMANVGKYANPMDGTRWAPDPSYRVRNPLEVGLFHPVKPT